MIMEDIVYTSIIEDSTTYLKKLEELFADSKFKVISSDTRGLKGISSVRKYHPAIVMLDFQLTDITGIEVSKKIKIYEPDTKVFMLTMHCEIPVIERMINEKTIDAIAIKSSCYFGEHFLSAVNRVAAGETYLDPSILKVLRTSNELDSLNILTGREFEVFVQTNMGKTDLDIAEDLFVDIAHVKNLKSRIAKKISGRDINRLLVKLIENAKVKS
jgi:two-component system nitrate/nitrite response regulator NarP